jgi:tripartite-type tricarboxylate transporter receptor subunit TctC
MLKRRHLLSHLPSISEVAPGFAVEVWFGLLARAGTPPAVVARLADAIASVISQPDIIDKYRAVNVVARPGRNELAELLRGDHQLWSKVIQEKNIRLD